ncbi:MAG: hypothetical protein BM485_14585 [Desulfobulbaceae bacterium DB1]|nr:MAG: hypothetical protein BM485_14585 [Desulfobulbaceae bacterium DB1]
MKKTTSILLAIAFVVTSAGALQAASGKCTVTAVEGTKVILDCGSQAAEFPVGTEVKIKGAKGKAIEGC